MATVYLVKDGSAAHYRSDHGHALPVEAVVEKLVPFEKRFSENPPGIREQPEGHPADGDFRHVVVRIDESETNTVFPREGYYHIVELTPADCRGLFGIDAR